MHRSGDDDTIWSFAPEACDNITATCYVPHGRRHAWGLLTPTRTLSIHESRSRSETNRNLSTRSTHSSRGLSTPTTRKYAERLILLRSCSIRYLETAGSRCISHVKVKRRYQNGNATVFGESALETCVRGKVLTRQPEISQLGRGSKSAYRFFLSAGATEECSPRERQFGLPLRRVVSHYRKKVRHSNSRAFHQDLDAATQVHGYGASRLSVPALPPPPPPPPPPTPPPPPPPPPPPSPPPLLPPPLPPPPPPPPSRRCPSKTQKRH
ncbi:hypothetical protein ALC62_01569 [Cyphomyrmex costatus]|uniref:Uncharacterized protein n=1 Tax=Cyphomyrmex costatus TaxID=456900 RepID=A0A195D394_9HYME|nr:hypothetical protein ALC62_01569 [Cyphomyrmex costatus]